MTHVHDRITLASAGLLAPVFLAVPSDNRWLSWGVLTGSHLLSGLLFSPDLDVQAIEYRRWGPFRWIWWAYAQVVLHRSWLSHSLVFGPLLRLLYFVLVVDLLVMLVALIVQLAGGAGLQWLGDWHGLWADLMRAHPRRFLDVAIGFVTGGAFHTIPDVIQTRIKQLI